MWVIISKKTLFKVLLITIIACIVYITSWIKVPTYLETDPNTKGYIALIIDDFGNNGDGTNDILKLNIPITAAVIPFLPYSQIDADAAHKAGLEVIMHIPMEPIKGKKEWLGPGGITSDLSDQEIQQRINDGLQQIKWAVGMNNHMGSKATQDKRIMNIILSIAKQKNLIFIDSKTTSDSIAASVANELGVPCFERDIFLDNSKNKTSIENQMKKLGDLALKKGYAIGIGHVGPEGGTITAQAIKSMYPVMEKKGIHFIYVSQLKYIASHSAK